MCLSACHTAPQRSSNAPPTDTSVDRNLSQCTVTFDNGAAQTHFVVEVAHTPDAREKGLMYRRQLLANQGMLFAFTASEPRTFWMKNTFIPLDLIFLDHQKRVVGIIAEATPLSERPLAIAQASRYVVEVGGGIAKRAGIAIGTQARFLEPNPS